MLAKLLTRLDCIAALPDMAALSAAHVLILMPAADDLPHDCPQQGLLQATLARQKKKLADLKKEALVATAFFPASGDSADPATSLHVWRMLNPAQSTFSLHTAIREALEPLQDEEPAQIDILLLGDADFRAKVAVLASYVGLVNSTPLPVQKKHDPEAVYLLKLWQVPEGAIARVRETEILAAANVLARQLTVLPPNVLTPASYRARLRTLADMQQWEIDEYDFDRLRMMMAGAFLAVAQGSPERDAAIVRLSYQPGKHEKDESGIALPETLPRLALVGKGICFDTGGHNLKPAKYMQDMHEDMAGSAAALGLLLAITRLQLPVRVDAWLALSRNDIAPQAYRQADIVTALNGTTIEVVHTDAEGRMALADTLTLVARQQPDLMIDFATLTGSMIEALGVRLSGVFATDATLGEMAVAAGETSGERVCLFPMPEDFDEALESDRADILQCTMDSEADHILAARFLKRFTDDLPWLHLDLSAANCEGGLGAIASDQTGFGVAWGMAVVKRWLAARC